VQRTRQAFDLPPVALTEYRSQSGEQARTCLSDRA